MAVKNVAMIDLETSLTTKLTKAWLSEARPLLVAIQAAIDAGEFSEADRLVDRLSFAQTLESKQKMLDTFAVSSVLLGVSRIGDVDESRTDKDFPRGLVDAAISQFMVMMGSNAEQYIRKSGHALVHRMEMQSKELEGQLVKADFNFLIKGALELAGAGSLATSANLMVSRLNSLGFLAEAALTGVTTYEISAELDEDTCPACEEMDGRVFEVEHALDHIVQSLQTEDPNVLRSIAPWPDASRAGAAALRGMSDEDMAEAGFETPPYHPNCRCIVTVTDSDVEEPKSAVARILESALITAVIGEAIFGNKEDAKIIEDKKLGRNAAATREVMTERLEDGSFYDQSAGGISVIDGKDATSLALLVGTVAGAEAEKRKSKKKPKTSQ